ncbi:efflux RND transporter periplasmic adaptor subunit [bacterium]
MLNNIKNVIIKNRYYLLGIVFIATLTAFYIIKKKNVEKSSDAYQEKKTEKQQGEEKKDKFVRVFKTKKILFEDTIDGLIGTVRGASFEIKSSQEEKLVKYHYKRGDYVKGDTLIAELDHTRSKAKLNQAELAYDRVVRLLRVGGATRHQLQEVLESVNIARKDYEDTFLLAPENGYIGDIMIEEGELISRQSPVFTFVSNEKIYRIETNIIETKVPLIKRGHDVKINIEAIPDEQIFGKVLSVAPEATTSSRMVPVIVSIPWKYMKKLKPGLSARLSISIYKNNSFIVPKSSIIPNKSAVFVVTDGKAEFRSLEIGYQSRDYVEILEGISESELVIVNQLRAGIKEGDSIIYNQPIEYEEETENNK